MIPLYMAKTWEGLMAVCSESSHQDNDKPLAEKQDYLRKMRQGVDVSLQAGDQEKAFVLLMRSMEFFSLLPSTMRDSKELAAIGQSVEQDLNRLAELKVALKARYQANHVAPSTLNHSLDRQKKNGKHNFDYDVRNESQDNENDTGSYLDSEMDFTGPTITKSHSRSQIEVFRPISPDKLYQLRCRAEAMIVIDTRSKAYYDKSHIKGSGVVNVPEDLVQGGKFNPASALATLQSQERVDLMNCCAKGKVVFVDRDGKSEPDSPLYMIGRTLTNPKTSGLKFLCAPYLLVGGYSYFLGLYPAEVTNPIDARHAQSMQPSIHYPTLLNAAARGLLEYKADTDADYSDNLYPEFPSWHHIGPKSGDDHPITAEAIATENGILAEHPTINRATKPGLGAPPRPTSLKPKANELGPLTRAGPISNHQVAHVADDAERDTAWFTQELIGPLDMPAALAKKRGGNGLRGLVNMGNTCYMNSIVQCLSNTMRFSVYFIDRAYLHHINTANPLGTGGELARAFGSVLEDLWSGKRGSLRPSQLKAVISKFAPRFAGSEQHDSQELLSFLMDGLHEDLNRATDRTYVEEDYSGLADDVAALMAWKNHVRRNRSVVVDLFQGQLKDTVQCLQCQHTSTTFSVFMYLTLPVPPSTHTSLSDCLDSFTKPEVVSGANQWYCSKCKAHSNAVKRLQLWKLPAVLYIHFKRFETNPQTLQHSKIGTEIKFPLRDLNLSPYMRPGRQAPLFQLEAVSNHWGTIGSGHYTTYSRNIYTNRWYHYDDERITDLSETAVASKGAYVLQYAQQPTKKS